MLERLAAWFLNTYVAEYVGNLNTDQLSIGILSGAVELENLTLKKDALHKLRLPIDVKAGYIGKLCLKIPVRYIKSQPWEIQIDQLYVVAGPPDIEKYDHKEEEMTYQIRKKAKLLNMENKWREEQQGNTSWFWTSFANSFTSTVADNLQITVNDIHIRYEDHELGEPHPFVIGMIIEQLTLQSTNENWEPQFISSEDKSYKLVNVCNLNVYCDSVPTIHLDGQEFVDAMYRKGLSVTAVQNMMSSSYFTGTGDHLPKHIIKPFSAQCQIVRNCLPDPLRISDGPRINVKILVNEVPIVLSENQFCLFVKLSNAFKLRMIAQKYRHLRPTCPIKENSQIWWKFAIDCILTDIKSHRRSLSLDFLLSRARQCVNYVQAYTCHLTQTTVEQNVSNILECTEKQLKYEEIVILRRIVMQRIEKKRELAKEVMQISSSETEQQGIIHRWFPTWVTGAQSYSSGQDDTLNDINEEELIDELGLEMDGNDKIMRDRIFAHVSFHLSKGTLQLVSDKDTESFFGPQLLIEIELNALSCHFDYRPRLKYSCLEIQLGGVSIHDDYQEDSIFSTLVQPKASLTSAGDIFQLQLIKQEIQTVYRYNLNVVTRPLDVVYNQYTTARIKDFFTISHQPIGDHAAKLSGMVGEVDHTFLDNLLIKLDISAPQIIIPQDFVDDTKPMVVIDLGHLTFESISTETEEAVNLKDSIIDVDIVDDDEFVTPPSTPPPEDELVLESTDSVFLQKSSKQIKIKKYFLKLSEIQILIGKYTTILTAGQSSAHHLLDQFSLLVEIEREILVTPQIKVMANLPLLHFHLNEYKIYTLLCCLIPQKDVTEVDQSMYMSFVDNNTSIYESAAVMEESLDIKHSNVMESSIHKTLIRHLSAEIASSKLLKGQINVDEVLLDIASKDCCIAEIKILNVKAGVIKRPYDITSRLLVEDIFVVDKTQKYGPQYELLVSSSGRGLSPSNNPATGHVDVFVTDTPFLLNISILCLTPLSIDHPSVMVPSQGGLYNASVDEAHIKKVNLQCTPLDVIANQKTIVEIITFVQKSIPPHISKTNRSSINESSTTKLTSTVASNIEISVEMERLGIKILKTDIDIEKSIMLSLIAASIDIIGVGMDVRFDNNEVNISGYIEGSKVTDLTVIGRKFSNILSLGTCREGQDHDMITTMMTSYDSLKKLSDCVSFSITKTQRNCDNFDIKISAHVPSILYTHSTNFIQEMEIFTQKFLEYFDDIKDSMRSAAIDVAKGLVSEKSQIADGLNKLSSTFVGSSLHSIPKEEDETSNFAIDCVHLDVLIKSPVVVIPNNLSSEDTLIAHLGEISVKNEFLNMSDQTIEQEMLHGFVLSSDKIEKVTLHVSNMTLHSSQDPASRDWLVSELQDDTPIVSGQWRQIIKKTSFVFKLERALGKSNVSNRSHSSDMSSDEEIDVKIGCFFPSPVHVTLPNQVFTQIKSTLKNGIYKPVVIADSKASSNIAAAHHSVKEKKLTSFAEEKLPKIFASFSLPRLSFEIKHLIGHEEKQIVFISLDDFFARCYKVSPFYTCFELALKHFIIEDLLQTDETYRYILSSTYKPLPFKSPVATPSSTILGISPRQLLPLTKLISSPKPPQNLYSPLASFDPFSTDSDDIIDNNGMTTPPAVDVSISSSVTDIQDIIAIKGFYVTSDCPEFSSKYNNINIHVDIAFSSVYLVINLQTWVLLFDYLDIGVPTPPTSPVQSNSIYDIPIPHLTSLASPTNDGLDMYSLRTDGSVYIIPDISKLDSTSRTASNVHVVTQKGTVWGVEGKISLKLNLKVPSLTVTFNKSNHPLARGTAKDLYAELESCHGNVKLEGHFGQASLIDLTETGSYYRERFTTTGDQALTFDIFKFGKKDPQNERPYDISVNIHLSAVRYLHTMRFLKEMIAFCQHFPQLIDAFQRMKAISHGNLYYTPERKPRILLEVKADEPMILIPKHAFSSELMGGVIKLLTLRNKFLFDGERDTLTHIRGSGTIPRIKSTPGRLNSITSQSSILKSKKSKADEDKELIETVLLHQGPCLLDCIELILSEVDVFSARKIPTSKCISLQDGYNYKIERDKGQLLKERGKLKLQIERNLYEDFCRSVPDIHIDGTLSAVHLMLDKRQLEIIKGLIDMNLGEQIEEFEKPSSVIRDPVAQPIVASVWTGFRFHIEFVGVQLEFLQSRGTSPFVDRSLALFDIHLSEFTFESNSDQTKTVDFTSHAVIVYDTRYRDCNDSMYKPNAFEEVLRPRYNTRVKKSLQVEIHVIISPTYIKASILLNKLRLIGVVDLLMELKEFVIGKLPSEEEDNVLEDVDSGDIENTSIKDTIATKIATSSQTNEYKPPERDVKIGVSVTETDLVVVEDLTNIESNAVVLKGTVVLQFRSPPKHKGSNTLQCTINGLELFSCCVSHEEDTALSILDPVSVEVELKPLDTPLDSDDVGSHLLKFDIQQLNIRLSYNDIKLFLAILQNLQLQSLTNKMEEDTAVTSTVTNEKFVKLLLPLGFSRAAILKELSRSSGDINVAALQLLEEKENKKLMKLNSLQVDVETLNICLIDDFLNHDVPLLELSLSTLQATNSIAAGIEGKAITCLSLDYYNRNISAWEPLIEPWKLELMWRKVRHFSTDLDTNEKPDRISFIITSPEILNINLTSSLLHLLKDTQSNWSSDFHIDRDFSHKQNEQELLKIQHKKENKTVDVQKGLALLHSVRFISQSRQRTKYIPFVIKNSTGLPLKFATHTSLPAKVVFNPSVLLSSPTNSSINLTAGPPAGPPAIWTTVLPNEETSFDFISHKKIRHKDTRALVVHQLRIQLEGWNEINVPISVDKIGVFFRDIHHSNGHNQTNVFFAISLSDTRKIVNVRSGIVIHNTLDLPVEVKLESPNNADKSIGLPVILPAAYSAVPVHLTNWNIKVRPQGWGLKFCSTPLSWQHVVKSTSDLKVCESIGNTSSKCFRFCVQIKPEFSSNKAVMSYTIKLIPYFTVCNLLPFAFKFCYHGKEKYIHQDKDIPIHMVNLQHPISCILSHLECFEFSESFTVSFEDVGVVKSLIVRDKMHRPLSLCITTESIVKGSLKISIWCQYWIMNHTGLPLMFCCQSDTSNDRAAAGQFEEHESACELTPLLYSYPEDDLLQKCQVRIGKDYTDGNPLWSSGFRMLRENTESDVIRLFVRRGDGRPDIEYQIGMQIRRGQGKHQVTKLVTFVARFQLENKTPFKLAYLQRHLIDDTDLLHVGSDIQVLYPESISAFHWPRADLDQLLCIKVLDLTDSYWSGGFPLEHDKSFHINMRRTFGRSVFIRCEVTQYGATYNIKFSDASDYPPPFKLENLSQVSVLCYQQGITYQHQYTTLNSGQSVPYSWDDITLPEKLCIHISGISEPRQFDLNNFGPQGKVYYESYFYIVAMETGTQINEELVLDVPQGKAVILTKKSLERRSQLWRMTANGQLVHVYSSTNSAKYVLDLSEPLPKGHLHGNKLIPLVLSPDKNSLTQIWRFEDNRLILSEYPHYCIQCRHGYESKMEGGDAVIGMRGGGCKEKFIKQKKSPGSGVLSVSVVPDGPTRVLCITDENKKYTYRCTKDDWIIIDRGLVAPANATDVDIVSNEIEDVVKSEYSVSLSLDKGLCISLINSVPEELILATCTGIRIEYISTSIHQCLNTTIQYIQIDNQLLGGINPVIAFPTPTNVNYPVINCFIERLPHKSPLAIVFRTVDVKIKQITLLLEEKLLFKILQWAGIGTKQDNRDSTQEIFLARNTTQWNSTSTLSSFQVYIEQLNIHTTELLVTMHTTSQLPPDLSNIKKQLGFPLVQFESPILLEGFQKSHVLETPLLFVDAIIKHYKKVILGQAVMILGSVDFLGNPIGLLNDVASGVQGMIALQPDVVGLVRNVAHGMSDTTSKLTGTVSHAIGQATGDNSYQEEREQNLESCHTSSEHFQAGLINLTSGIFGGMTSMLTQPYKGAVEQGVGGFIWGIGKGAFSTIAKPVVGILDFASGTTAALRETMSQVSHDIPHPIRLRRCCIDATGAVTCFSIQLARGQEYLLQLNDGNVLEKLIAYEKFKSGEMAGEMRVIISSNCLYFFDKSPPDQSSLNASIQLDQLLECRSTVSKTTIPAIYIVLSLTEINQGVSIVKTKKYKCANEPTARKIVQLINYARNLHQEEKMILHTHRLPSFEIW